MLAVRARRAFDGDRFLPGGATVLVHAGKVVGVEARGCAVPHDCKVVGHDGTLLPGLIDAHTHLVADGSPGSLERAAGLSADRLDAVIDESLATQLAAGVTTVRDLGDPDYAVVARRDAATSATEPTIVASGPPLTVAGGHCHYLGGAVAGPAQTARAVREREQHGVDVVKVMASGGMTTDGTDITAAQFGDADLRLLVEEAHAAGLPVTAHAHALAAVEQALAVGVDGIEHCTCLTPAGQGRAGPALVERLAASGVAVCPTLGFGQVEQAVPLPGLRRLLEAQGSTLEDYRRERLAFVGRLHAAGVRLISGVDSGVAPTKKHGTLPGAVADLVLGGVPVADALVTATAGAAVACGLGGRKGRLAPGYDADLLLVPGDLAADVRLLGRPDRVFLAGRPVRRARPAQPLT